MKKSFLLLTLLLLSLTISASEIIDGICYNLNTEAKTATVSKYNYSGDIVIPSFVTFDGVDYSVTSIGRNAFYECSELTSVTIPNSVTSISLGAFQNCSSLTSITIPKSVTTIQNSVFRGCTNLANIQVESENTVYDSRENCNAIIETASNTLLSGCNSTIIPNSVTSINTGAFYGSGLTSINIPKNITSIGINAFYNCTSLTKVELNNNAIFSLDINEIFGKQVEEYILGEDITSIGRYKFSESTNLTTVRMSESVTNIDDWAFYGCSKLTSINIPSGITYLANFTFWDCNLTKVEINSNYLMSNYSLSGWFGDKVEEYIIGNDITSISGGRFSGCDSLSSIQVKSGNTIYDSRDNCNAIIETATNTLISGCKNTTIPNSVKSIGGNAFSYCSGLTSINIPNSVTSIGNGAFDGCSGLTSINIPNSITSIGSYAFYRCSGLTSINIPNSMTSIGSYAFLECSGLTSINIPNTVTSIGNGAFSYCTSLTNLQVESNNTVYDSRENCNAIIETATNTLISGCQNTIIPNDVINIGMDSFYGCSNLTEITIPNSVKSIGGWAFVGCPLTSLTIPESVVSIAYASFSAYALTAIQVESGNTMYNSRDNCNAIISSADNTLILGCQNTIIPDNVEKIGDYAFAGCRKLNTVNIPYGVTTIGHFAFSGCDELKTVILPKTIAKIGNWVFSGDWRLTDVYCYAEQLPEIGESVFSSSSDNSTLHVPATSIDTYKNAKQWKDFRTIVALTDEDPKPTTSIEDMRSSIKTIEHYYTIDGKQIPSPQRGLNIIKMSNGTTKKVILK